jgi:hypothetical protein
MYRCCGLDRWSKVMPVEAVMSTSWGYGLSGLAAGVAADFREDCGYEGRLSKAMQRAAARLALRIDGAGPGLHRAWIAMGPGFIIL